MPGVAGTVRAASGASSARRGGGAGRGGRGRRGLDTPNKDRRSAGPAQAARDRPGPDRRCSRIVAARRGGSVARCVVGARRRGTATGGAVSATGAWGAGATTAAGAGTTGRVLAAVSRARGSSSLLSAGGDACAMPTGCHADAAAPTKISAGATRTVAPPRATGSPTCARSEPGAPAGSPARRPSASSAARDDATTEDSRRPRLGRARRRHPHRLHRRHVRIGRGADEDLPDERVLGSLSRFATAAMTPPRKPGARRLAPRQSHRLSARFSVFGDRRHPTPG